MNRWWECTIGEDYWIEVTDREDLGSDLRAPLFDDSGVSNWRYTLFKGTQVGDTVFHYSTKEKKIVAKSIVAKPPINHPIVWGARGSYAREKGTTPHERPGYRVQLQETEELTHPVSIEDIESEKYELQEIVSTLKKQHGPIYFPFELSTKRRSRPLQGYAFKLPAAFISLFPRLGVEISIEPTSDYDELNQRARALVRKWRTSGKTPQRPAGQQKPKKVKKEITTHYVRDPQVKAQIMMESEGRCELCKISPFEDIHGFPFLEIHHVRWLSLGGSDTVENAVVLCPNCHRACHYARNREELVESLYSIVDRLIRE